MPRESLHISEEFKPLLSRADFSAPAVFTHPDIIAWRKLGDRENCTWSLPGDDGPVLLHVKRFFNLSAADEAEGYRLLQSHGIPTATLVAWGRMPDRRSFLISQDLTGYQAADKLIYSAETFQRLLVPTAALVAKLHNAGLHHRDLYLCHFFVKIAAEKIEARLIDVARVRPLPIFPRQRWLVKDLAQFWYSTLSLPITRDQRLAWLAHYAAARAITRVDSLRNSIEKKSAWIGAHDANLRRKQPLRNISIPVNERMV